MKYKNCEVCNRLVSLSVYERHFQSHFKEKKHQLKIDEEWYDEISGLYKCPECQKLVCKKGICSHIIINHTEEGRKRHFKSLEKRHKLQIGKPSWNKSLTKETSESVRKSAEKVSKRLQKLPKEIRGGFAIYQKNHKEEWLKNCSRGGGLRKMSGKGHRGWYKGYYCQSSWELAFVIYNIEHGILFNRNFTGFTYIYEGKEYKYYPDFIIDGEYFEIKGYKDKKCITKISQFKQRLKVLEKDDMKIYLDYVIEKYGSDFISLYEEHRPIV